MSAESLKHLHIDSGQTIQSFLTAEFINELTITVIPILLGSGKLLFGSLPADIHLQHRVTTVLEFGFVQHRYRVLR